MATTAMNMKGFPARCRAALKARRMQIMTAAAAVASAGLVQGASALSINTTDVDTAFDVLSEHIIPKMGEVISATPGIIVPLVILIVLVMVLFFFPKLLNSLLSAIEGAIRGKMG